MLTREQIDVAKRDRLHVAIRALDDIGPRHWETLRDRLANTKGGNKEKQRLSGDFIIPFAETLEGQAFTLQPLEIVSIGAKAMELFPGHAYPRYSLATSIAFVFGAAAIDSEKWRHLFKGHEQNQDRYLQHLAFREEENAAIFRAQLAVIFESLAELDYYTYGTRENVFELAKRAVRSEDPEAEREMERVEVWQREHREDVLSEIHENWGNGVGLVSAVLEPSTRTASTTIL